MSERPGPSPEEQQNPEITERDKLFDESLKTLAFIVGHHPDAITVRNEPERNERESVFKRLPLEHIAGLSWVELVHWGEHATKGDWVASFHLPDPGGHPDENPTSRQTYDWYPIEREIRGDLETEAVSIEDERFVNSKLNQIMKELQGRGEI